MNRTTGNKKAIAADLAAWEQEEVDYHLLWNDYYAGEITEQRYLELLGQVEA